MRLSQRMTTRILAVNPGQSVERIVLDKLGIHHTTIPARNFAQEAANHRNQSNVDVAESLYVVDRLADLGAVTRNTVVQGQGAVVQAFRGNSTNHQGSHTMPCQLVLDARFPHQLHFNSAYFHRTVQLFARCTWSPRVVNGMDQLLDWSPDSDFVMMYLDAVRGVLAGKDPTAAYGEFAWKRSELLKGLLRRLDNEPLSNHEAMVLMGAVSLEPGAENGMSSREVQRLLADHDYLETLDEQREIIIEKYGECDQMVPHTVRSGQLEDEVQRETW